jgi:SecD/SecF fusion protein
MGKKWYFLVLSLVLVLVSIGGLAFRGLNLGIEFRGGTVIDFTNAGNVTIGQMRDAFVKAGVSEPGVQSIQGGGYLVRFAESNPDKANAAYQQVIVALSLPSDAGDVTTIGPGWGKLVTNRALLAAALAIAAILLYISLRFDYKMSLTAVLALVHDGVIVMGIYSLSSFQVTPNTIAALLTILGYSLYDTIVVFHRIKENSQHISKQTFSQMANDSINQVIVRSMNTSITSLIPVVMLLIFGGTTLRDFAFALTIGLLSGAYSSIGVASIVYSMWRETEPRFQALKKKYAAA